MRRVPVELPALALSSVALAACFQPLPSIPESDGGSLFDTGLDDLGVDFDAGQPPDARESDAAGDGSGSGLPEPPTPTLREVSAAVFEPACGDCHIEQTLSDLWLASNAGLRDRLLRASLQSPSLPLVAPGNADGSYLWRKVEGSHLNAGGLGEPMPLGAAQLGETQTEILRRWIAGGAPP